MISITINGIRINADENDTVLSAAKSAGIYIPTLCMYEGMSPKASCGLCSVLIGGESKERLACATKVKEGMSIITDSDELFAKRKAAVQELFRQHTVDCHHCLRIGTTDVENFDTKFCENCFFCDCVRDGFCELQQKALEFGIDELPFEIHEYDFVPDTSAGCLIRNPNKCIKCRRCIDICKAQGVDILGIVRTQNGPTVGAKNSLASDGCIKCGRCVDVCPTGALFMKESIDEELFFAHSYDTCTAALLDISVVNELERLFAAPEGSFTLEKIADGLKKIGIDYVYNADEFECTEEEVSALLNEKLSDGVCTVLARDFASKTFLEKKYPQLKDRFVFIDSSQKRFAEKMKKLHPGAKLYHISGVNSYGAEAFDGGMIDYFINARQLYRLFKRTGVDVSRRRGISLDSTGEGTFKKSYLVPDAGQWKFCGGIEETDAEINGEKYTGAFCFSLRSAEAAIENISNYDFISVIG